MDAELEKWMKVWDDAQGKLEETGEPAPRHVNTPTEVRGLIQENGVYVDSRCESLGKEGTWKLLAEGCKVVSEVKPEVDGDEGSESE